MKVISEQQANPTSDPRVRRNINNKRRIARLKERLIARIAANRSAAILADRYDAMSCQTLYTVAQFALVEPAFTQAALRNLIFKAVSRHSSKGIIPGNGLLECGAIVRRGRRVRINRIQFLNWAQQSDAAGSSS
jgi:hypothetical protein